MVSTNGRHREKSPTLKRTYNLKAPKGVNGRNSDNTLIKKLMNWEPNTKLADGMEKTYRWIYDQMKGGTNPPAESHSDGGRNHWSSAAVEVKANGQQTPQARGPNKRASLRWSYDLGFC